MNIVKATDYSLIKARFSEEIKRFPIINAVIQAKMKGFVFSDPNFVNLFICSNFGWSLLIINEDSKIENIFEFLKNTNEIPDYIHIYSLDKKIIDVIKKNWSKVKIRRRVQFVNSHINLPELNRGNLPKGYSIQRVQDIERSKLDVFNLDLANRYWQSYQHFKEEAIGFCIINTSGDPVAICYSICFVDRVSEVDICVLPDYSGRSFGFYVSMSFLNALKDKGIFAHWDSFSDNYPSLNLAKKLNFIETRSYDLVSIFLRDW